MRGLIVAIGIVALLAIAVFIFVNNGKKDNKTTQTTNSESSTDSNTSVSDTQTNTGSETASGSVTITYTDSGFSPSKANLLKGGTITWVNNSSDILEVGVNPHPSHTDDRTITNNEFVLTLQPGQSSDVVVNKTGTFGYHNHLNPDDTGTVVVQ